MIRVVEELKNAANAPSDSVLVGGDLLMEAADEIERLRRLITEWADAAEAESKAFYGELTDAIWRRSAAEKALFEEAYR